MTHFRQTKNHFDFYILTEYAVQSRQRDSGFPFDEIEIIWNLKLAAKKICITEIHMLLCALKKKFFSKQKQSSKQIEMRPNEIEWVQMKQMLSIWRMKRKQ